MIFETIETDRLILKGLSPQDMTYIFEHMTKPEIMNLLGHRSEEDYQKEEHKQKNGYAAYNRSFMLFLLTDKASGTIIGRCGLHNRNAEHRRAELGYVMENEDFKRKGLMTEAVDAVIKYGFGKMNLNRIEALVDKENVPSLRILRKYNFIEEGVLRQHIYRSGNHEDSLLFSKLYGEYIAERDRM